jgi:hypothetical protein
MYVPGPQRRAGHLHRGGFRPGGGRQLLGESYLPSRSAIPGPGGDRAG